MIYYLFIKVKIQVFYRQNSGNLLFFLHRALCLKNINTVFRWSRQSSPLKSIARILFFFYRIHLFLNGLVLIQPWHNVHIFNETIINGLHFKNISRRKKWWANYYIYYTMSSYFGIAKIVLNIISAACRFLFLLNDCCKMHVNIEL